MKRKPRLDIIKRALKTSDLADLAGAAMNTYTALYGRPTEQVSPLEQVEDAHRRRDFIGVIDAAQAGQRSLETQPWYPARAGDLVHVAYDALPPHFPAHGETYIVEEREEGWFDLRLIAHTRPKSMGEPGDFAADDTAAPLFDMWFEAGPAVLTIVRDGRVVHGGA